MACPNFDNTVARMGNIAAGPLQVEGDAGMVKQRPAMDLIAIANYFAGICASKTRRLGVRYTHLRPDGTVHVRPREAGKGFEV